MNEKRISFEMFAYTIPMDKQRSLFLAFNFITCWFLGCHGEIQETKETQFGMKYVVALNPTDWLHRAASLPDDTTLGRILAELNTVPTAGEHPLAEFEAVSSAFADKLPLWFSFLLQAQEVC